MIRDYSGQRLAAIISQKKYKELGNSSLDPWPHRVEKLKLVDNDVRECLI